MNDHQSSPLDVAAVLASFTTIFAGWSLEQWFGFIGILGMIFTAVMQYKRNVRESEYHQARMKNLTRSNASSIKD